MPDALRVLVVEDDAILAMGLVDDLEDLGYLVLGPVPSERAAFRLLEAQDRPPDAAVLDYDLGDHTSARIHERLITLGVPAAFVTGHAETVRETAGEGTPVLAKPCRPALLGDTLSAMLRDRRPV